MAAQVTYATIDDVESVVLTAPAAPARASSRAACFASLLGLACAAVLVLQMTTAAAPSQLRAQVRAANIPARPLAPLASNAPAAPNVLQKIGNGLAALSLTTMANLGTPYVTPAMELDVLSTPTPTAEYIFDDGGLLSKATVADLGSRLPEVEQRTGYRINVVTLKKLTSSDDAFQFADNLIETWYPTAELGDKKAVLVIVKGSKEGGLVGGPSFTKKVPRAIVESIVGDNLAQLVGEEKFNQAVVSTVDRLDAALSGRADPGAPKALFAKAEKQTQTYKTKEETDSKRGVYGTVFGALVVISFVAPMVQFFTYTKDE